ncbi:uncharacterized protein BT62DRAFT_332427 [Guyanagaster necrorhizus]|nr:uncharacterized protein BT62DRAFT_332427 [Guyanagaster necrorhizus MCA 3950]KAG7443458.1 hypothetical protein BT62DRAFT_332427 [Guyanagaster necrorhizus MCA 3950]
MITIHCIHSRFSFRDEWTRLSYFLPIWCEPACPCECLDIFHESFGTSIWSSHECSDSSQNARFQWDSNAYSIYASRNTFNLMVAFRLERAIGTNQPPMPPWPWKVQVAILLPYLNDDR